MDCIHVLKRCKLITFVLLFTAWTTSSIEISKLNGVGGSSHTISAASSHQIKDESGHCIWYDTCTGCDQKYNIVYNGTGYPLTEQSDIDTLTELCPELMAEYSDPGQKFCCSPTQINNIFLGFLDIIACPACAKNLRTLFCHMTCDPFQSHFVSPDQVALLLAPNGTKVEVISSLNVYVRSEFVEGLWDSCKDHFTYSDAKSLCGRYAYSCNGYRLLTSMGTSHVASFPIHFKFAARGDETGVDTDPFNRTITACNEASNTSGICSCSDCAASCPVPSSTPQTPQPWIIAGIDGLSFIIMMIFLCLTAILLGLVISKRYGVEGLQVNSISRAWHSVGRRMIDGTSTLRTLFRRNDEEARPLHS